MLKLWMCLLNQIKGPEFALYILLGKICLLCLFRQQLAYNLLTFLVTHMTEFRQVPNFVVSCIASLSTASNHVDEW